MTRGPAVGSRPVVTEAVPWSADLLALMLLGAIWCTSFLAQRSLRKIVITVVVHVAWLATFSWYGWFSTPSPFRLHELRVPSAFSGVDAGWAIAVHYIEALGVFALLVMVYSGIPLIAAFVPSAGSEVAANSASPRSEWRFLVLSTILFAIFFTHAIWQSFTPAMGWGFGQAVEGCAFIGALVLVSMIASYGSWKAFALGLSEIFLIPAAWLLR